jgi:hypothetical protein
MPNKHNREEAQKVKTSGRLIAQKIPKDKKTEAIRILDDQGRSSTTDLDDRGMLRYSIEGPSSTGESGTLEVCSIFIERLNQDGSHWGKPHPPEGREVGIDCETTDGTSKLNIQVTRAADFQLWRILGR